MSRNGLRPPRRVQPLEEIGRVDEELLRLLRGLEPTHWSRPASTAWTVREVAAHLLDGNLRRLSLDRDEFMPDLAPPAGDDFVSVRDFLDRLNAEWIRAARRLSPRVVVELLEVTNGLVLEHFRRLDPESPAAFAVAWAGQDRSPAWLDIAREYTEKWHHQHQIRAAVGAPELEDPVLLEPLLRTLVWALPRAYDDAPTEAGPGTLVTLRTTGPLSCAWALRRDERGWSLHEVAADVEEAAGATVDGRELWRILLGSDDGSGREGAERQGPEALTSPIFDAVGLMV